MSLLQSELLLVLFAVLQIAHGRVKDACYTKNYNDLRIIGGHKIPIQSAPYMAGLLDTQSYLICGGAIIHEQFVVTTADCLEDTIINEVHVGSNAVKWGGFFIDIDEIFCYEDFNPENYDNNICLIKLWTPLVFSNKIAKIDVTDETFTVKDGTMVNITGWGSITNEENGRFPKFLRQTTIPVVSEECCRKVQPNKTENLFCAGSAGRDSCEGDAGGPVTLNNLLVGLISHGEDCGTQPGLNVRVSNYAEWIDTTISNNL